MAKEMTNSPRASLWTRLIALAEARPEVQALDRLNKISDEALAARGLTRMGEIRRILGARYIA
jgi:hypothetical protein